MRCRTDVNRRKPPKVKKDIAQQLKASARTPCSPFSCASKKSEMMTRNDDGYFIEPVYGYHDERVLSYPLHADDDHGKDEPGSYEDLMALMEKESAKVEGAKLEQQKFKHMIKREFKSAQRELRRDNEFINKIRHKRKEQSDRERKDKVKRIFNEASIQESEYKANARTKGRKSKF